MIEIRKYIWKILKLLDNNLYPVYDIVENKVVCTW
jgi:hypothetical protein